jgi:hypothetical protein
MCGVVEKTQGLYEAAVRRPDSDYLEAFARAGGDVLYLITGAQSSTALTEEERMLLSSFRQADTVARKMILGAAAVAAKTLQETSRARASS